IDAMNGRSGGVFLSRQSLPLTTRAQHINDGVKDQAKGRWVAATRSRQFLWPQDWRNQTPQIVGDMPNCRYRGFGRHNFSPSKEVSTKKVYASKTFSSFLV